MEKQTVHIGTIVVSNSGQELDNRRKVEFVGEELARRTEYGWGRNGGITDTRGVTETLYRTEDGRLIVHVNDWSRWRGEPNVESIHEVTEADLGVGGRFEELGAKAGFGRALTIDEAIKLSRVEP